MSPIEVPKTAPPTSHTLEPEHPPTLDYATPRSVIARVKVPHPLYALHRHITTNRGGWLLTLIYCLITLIVGGIFKMCGVVFVDAKSEKGAGAPRGPAV